MTPASTLSKLSDLARAADLLFQHGLITLEEGHRIAIGIFDMPSGYEPRFLFLPTKGDDFPSFVNGWVHGGLEAGLDAHGVDAVKFIQSKPAYGESTYLKDTDRWLVCVPRHGPKPAVQEKSPPEPPKAVEPQPEPPKRGRGRPPKAAEPANDDIPFMD